MITCLAFYHAPQIIKNLYEKATRTVLYGESTGLLHNEKLRRDRRGEEGERGERGREGRGEREGGRGGRGRWIAIIENKGLRICRLKTEYLVPSHQQGVVTVVKLEGEPLPSIYSFKYLGSVIDGSGGCRKDVDGRIKVAWSKWRDLSGVIYDKKVHIKLKSKLYKTVVRSAMVLWE